MKRKRDTKRKTVILTVVSCVILILAGVLIWVLFFKNKGTDNSDNPSDIKSTAAAYLEYMNHFVCIDGQGIVIVVDSDTPDDIPRIKGISVKNIVVGSKISCGNESDLEYALKIIRALRQNSVKVDEIYVDSEGDATVYVNNLKILLGEDENTEKKLDDLRLFFESVENLDGTLYMQDYSSDNIGYSFRYTSENNNETIVETDSIDE